VLEVIGWILNLFNKYMAALQSDYEIISHQFAHELSSMVNTKLSQGYILSGGITYITGTGPAYAKYYQTVVKPVAPSTGGRRRSTRRRR
jgi:hypothetical protein